FADVGKAQQQDTSPRLQRLENLRDLGLATIGTGELSLLGALHEVCRPHVDQALDGLIGVFGFAHRGMPAPPPPHWRVADCLSPARAGHTTASLLFYGRCGKQLDANCPLALHCPPSPRVISFSWPAACGSSVEA